MELGWAWPYLLFGLIVLWIFQYYNSRTYKLISSIPSSEAPRFIGHSLDFIRIGPDGILNLMLSIFGKKTANQKVLAIWTGPFVFVYLRKCEDIEVLLSDNQQLRKAINYMYLEPWLGQGLINSDGEIWRNHRKIITPSFHFKVLEGFFEIMTFKLDILLEILTNKVGNGYFNIEPLIANYSLDIITETAMSTDVDAQRTNSKFVECIKSLTEVIIIRSVKIMYFFQFFFNFSYYKKLETRCLIYSNKFIKKILESKKAQNKKKEKKTFENDIGVKEKFALLDMLLEIQAKNPQFTDKEISDEVNTFMFAGHDTVSSALTFVLYMLSIHQDVQDKVYDEIKEVIGESKASYQLIMNLKYLERVIKETLRLYPSVPYIGRQLKKDMILKDGLVVPKNTNVAVFIYNHHRNPENFPDPEKFDPDRFLPQNSSERHPFAYIPFSAGSRNCIGQKFAMMELLITVTCLIRKYRISIEPGFRVTPVSHIVLRPNDDGLRVRLDLR